jgi:hypothetical protein
MRANDLQVKTIAAVLRQGIDDVVLQAVIACSIRQECDDSFHEGSRLTPFVMQEL